MFNRAPLHFELGLEPEACMCPQQLVQFWLTVEIEGFIGTYVMTRKYNCVLFHLRPGILLSNHQSMRVGQIPLIIHVHTPSLSSWPQGPGEQGPGGGLEQVHIQWWVRKLNYKKTDEQLAFCDHFNLFVIFTWRCSHFKAFLCKKWYVSVGYVKIKPSGLGACKHLRLIILP